MVVDPNELYKRRVAAAREAATERVTAERGTPSSAEQQAEFDAEVERLVTEWTKGWGGRGLGPLAGLDPMSLLRRWRARRMRH